MECNEILRQDRQSQSQSAVAVGSYWFSVFGLRFAVFLSNLFSLSGLSVMLSDLSG